MLLLPEPSLLVKAPPVLAGEEVSLTREPVLCLCFMYSIQLLDISKVVLELNYGREAYVIPSGGVKSPLPGGPSCRSFIFVELPLPDDEGQPSWWCSGSLWKVPGFLFDMSLTTLQVIGKVDLLVCLTFLYLCGV